MQLEIRKLGRDDAAAYWGLRLEAIEREPLSFGQTPEEHRLISMEETVALIEKPDSFLMGAFDGDTLVGIARFERETALKERHKGHLYRVYVSASHRGRGIARSLIRAVLKKVREDTTCEQILLSVGTFNHAARSLYASLGFISCGIEPRALQAGGAYVDEENMILIF